MSLPLRETVPGDVCQPVRASVNPPGWSGAVGWVTVSRASHGVATTGQELLEIGW